MALDFSNTAGSLFNRLGVLFGGIRDVNLALNDTTATYTDSTRSLLTLGKRIVNLDAQFASANQELVSGGGLMAGNPLYLARDIARTAMDQLKGYYASLAQAVLIQMVDDDVALKEKTVEAALRELLRQMADNDLSGDGSVFSPDTTVAAATTTVAAAAVYGAYGANTGSGKLVCALRRPDSRTNELALAETILLECQDDAGTGGTSGSESFEVRGEPAAAGELDWNWPLGSACATSLTSADPSLDAQDSGNLLTNSDWETWTTTTNPPDNWVATSSAPTFNTDVLKNTSAQQSGSNCLEFKGTASDKGVKQLFDASSGTTTALEPNTAYAWGVWAKDDGASLTAGEVRVDLVDGSEVQISDDSGTVLSTLQTKVAPTSSSTVSPTSGSILFSRTGASYTFFAGVFVTPKVLPTTYYLRISPSTGLTSAHSIYLDNAALVKMVECYAGGPLVAVFSGATAWAKGDRLTATVANTVGVFQSYFQRVYGLRTLGMQLPTGSGAVTTIADSRVTP